ncbi:MAG: hypothetical protein RLZZ142_720, partial [Verrucomicrobiota bacterium]
ARDEKFAAHGRHAIEDTNGDAGGSGGLCGAQSGGAAPYDGKGPVRHGGMS